MDSCFLCLPDTLSNELIEVAQSGFKSGFGVGSACLLAAGLFFEMTYFPPDKELPFPFGRKKES